MLSAEQRQLVEAHRGIVHSVVIGLGVLAGARDEAISEGYLALSECALSYDPEQAAFSTWAHQKVRWHLLDWMSRENKSRHFSESGGRSTKRDRGVAEFDRGFSAVPKSIGLSGQRHVDNDQIADIWEGGRENNSVSSAPSPESALLDKEADERIRAALDSADTNVRIVGTLTLAGRTAAEIEAATGLSESTIVRRRADCQRVLCTIIAAEDKD